MKSKAEKYDLLLRQIVSLIDEESDMIAVMGNVVATIHQEMKFWWTGFYRVKGNELVLGPFQGPVACMRIAYGKGVCGKAWEQGKTIVVDDVEKFPGHIACSAASRSEIVVPIFDMDNKVVAVLDIDSEQLAAFDDTDRKCLKKIVGLLKV